MLHPNLKPFLLSLKLEEALLFLVACKLDIDCQIDEQLFNNLVKHKIIEKDYTQQKIKINIPIFSIEDYDYENAIDSKVMHNIKRCQDEIDKYRVLFKGIRSKSIGDKQSCISNLIRWFSSNPEYDFDEVIEATEFYINNTDPKFISNADNFIYNVDKNGNEVSGLLIALEAMKMGNIDKRFN